MFKLFLCTILVSFASSAPGLVGHYPGAVSHVSRVDIHDSKPISAGYGYGAPVAYAPLGYQHQHGYGSLGHGSLGYGSPGYYGYGYGYPVAHSYANRIDVHASHVLASPYGHGYGGYGIHDGNGYGYAVHGYGIQGLHPGY